MANPLYYQTLTELSQHVRTGKVSVVEIVDACLARIDALNPRLNAFITVFADEARQLARNRATEIRAGRYLGPLDGIPVAFKDFYDTAGSRTTAAFEHFKNRIPKKDAVAVAKLRSAGAIVVGKTNMHTLGMGTTGLDSYFGTVRNPWNDAYIPGGSSSGSAAAVAAGLCYATVDTDAIGSCRLPAACCGDVGFKGTYGLISGQGILEGEKADEAILWLSHPGITTRSVADTSHVLNALAEGDGSRRDFHAQALANTTLRIGAADNFKADEEISSAFAAAVETLRGLGFDVSTSHAPFGLPAFGDLHAIESDRKTIAERAFNAIDVMVLPTTTTVVPAVTEVSGKPQALAPTNTMFANYFGLPAISIPCGFDSRGLPVGLQVVGKPWDEASVLQVARRYEAAAGQTNRPIPSSVF
jgi:aspartyl-tRNA(Asn)/glutamyl-tRNA(Gln) amidotransferase subunit A